MIIILFILVLNSLHFEAPSSFDSLKRVIIENKRTFAITHRFEKGITLDTYFFSSLSINHNVEIERITGMKKVSIPVLFSLLKSVKSLKDASPSSTMNLELTNGEWLISSNEPTFGVSLEYTSSVDSDFFGNLTVTSDSYISLNNDNSEGIVCQVEIVELSLESCGEHGGHIQDDIVQHVGLFNGAIKSAKCRPCKGDTEIVATSDLSQWIQTCTDSGDCQGGQTCEILARCEPRVECEATTNKCPCGMVCRKNTGGTPVCYFDDPDCCPDDETSIYCHGENNKCYNFTSKYCLKIV